MITYGSLFSGIGGMDLGLERSGMECRWQVEIDNYARRVLAKHWPDVRRWDDVRTWPQPDTERVDLICGGFPCQDISNAGKRVGIDGERSGLWGEFHRIIRELRPRIVLVENTPGLLVRGMDRVLGDLASSGYDAEWQSIPAISFGAQHIRDRVWITAYSNTNGERLQGRPERDGTTNNGREPPQRNDASGLRDDLSDSTSGRTGQRRRLEFSTYCETSRRLYWPEAEPGIRRVSDGTANRVDRLRGLGNACVPQVVEWIGRNIMTELDRRNGEGT